MAEAWSARLTGSVRPIRSGAPEWAPFARFAAFGLVTGWAWTVVIVTGLAAGVALFPVGLLITGSVLLLARVGARAERERLAGVLGLDLPDGERPLTARGFVARARAAAADAVVWRDVAWLGLLGPLATLSVLVAAVWIALAGVGTTSLIWLPGRPEIVLGIPVGSVWTAMALTLSGVFASISLRAVPGVALVPARWLARSLLGPDLDRLRSQNVALTAHSELVERVAAAERRRIERDLHDGAQQRMVSAGLAIGMLVERLVGHPDVPSETLDLARDAQAQVKASIVELRELAQGIQPTALAGGGLVEALEEMAGRSSVPVRLNFDVVEEPSPGVARVVYFVAAEAVTNVHRHASAQLISIDLQATNRRVRAVVSDDGVGGAFVRPGGGLAGLMDRVRSVGGSLSVESSGTGGTRLIVEVPGVAA